MGIEKKSYADRTIIENTNIMNTIVILPYFSDNKILNLNNGSKQDYLIHENTNDASNKENFEKWAKNGLPDVIIGTTGYYWDKVFGKSFSKDDYIDAYSFEYSNIWEGIYDPYYAHIFVKKDVAKKLNLKDRSQEYIWQNFTISDKWWQQFNFD